MKIRPPRGDGILDGATIFIGRSDVEPARDVRREQEHSRDRVKS
jgi:hypothetical protein